jgi:aquaporin Z
MRSAASKLTRKTGAVSSGPPETYWKFLAGWRPTSSPFALFQQHWPEYLMEAMLLALFMVSAAVFTMLIEHPSSPIPRAIGSALARRALSGIAMGLTAIALIYSPWGRQSGAHLNPAVTLTFYRLKLVRGWDAFFYMLSQFLGGTLAVLLIGSVAGELFRKPPVRYVATLPGTAGDAGALAAEFLISLLLMSVVLAAMNHPRLSRYTGVMCGALVALFITFEAPISGMSMNPARSFSSAAPERMWAHLWIYFVAPVAGMLAAVELRRWLTGLEHRACAKLHHSSDRRCIFCGYGALLLFIGASVTSHAAPTRTAGVALTVADLDRSIAFYRDVLSFRVCSTSHADDVRLANMTLGDEQLQLIQFSSHRGRPYLTGSGSNDLWFQHLAIVVSDMDHAYSRLRESRVAEISSGPQTLPAWNKAAAGIKALYFRDPDQHPLEVIYFPVGKGDPRWHTKKDQLFLGIDHTAIAITDTARSVQFYATVLGFHVAAESLNYGSEQERLNQVPGSRVRITALRNSSGLGIELLEYLTPGPGRTIPAAYSPIDLWHAHVSLLVSAPADIAGIVNDDNHARAAGDVCRAPLSSARACGVIHDPDGHELVVHTK